MNVVAGHGAQGLRQGTVLLVVGTGSTLHFLLCAILGEDQLARAGHFRVIVANSRFRLAYDGSVLGQS